MDLSPWSLPSAGMRICSLARWCAVADSEDHSLGVLAREDVAAGSHREPGQGRTDGFGLNEKFWTRLWALALGVGRGKLSIRGSLLSRKHARGTLLGNPRVGSAIKPAFSGAILKKPVCCPQETHIQVASLVPTSCCWVDGPQLRVRRRLQLLRASPLDLAGRLRLGKGLQPPPRTPDRLDFLDHQNAPRKAFPVVQHHLLVVHGCPLVVQF